MQSPIHEGYEYQDYFTVSIILQLMLQQIDAELIIDRKDFSGDKFDDLKLKMSNGNIEFQIKYSDDESSHKLTKDDLANGNGHDTALCDLFASWKMRKESENDTQIKLCLAWNMPTDDDPITEYLKPIQEQSLPFSVAAYSFDGDVFWPAEKLPPKSWRKFNTAIKSGLIDREAFLAFCNDLTIILEMPKASLDLKNPGALENVIIRQTEKLGVGIYPNDALNVEDIIYKLATEVKHSRAIGNRLYTNILVGRLGLIMDYGKFDQRFPVDSTHQIILGDEIERLHRVILDSKRVIISGNPGSGKSWLVDEYVDKLTSEDSKVIHYNCFQSLQDTNSLERIRVTSLYGNLVSQIVEQCPELVVHKNTIFGANKAELENLLCFIEEEFYLVVDGLDHIAREYELNKDFISHSEIEIISELLEIDFPDNCYVIISSQPINEIEKFKSKNYSVFEIEPWGIEQVKSLMTTFQISDDTIEDDDISSISAYILKKSQGNHLYDKSNSCVPFLKNNEEEYILIGCYETRTRIDYHQASFTFAYQGIVGDSNEENQIPFRRYLALAVGKGETYMISDNSESLINIVRTFDRELEDADYLWPSISISKLFNIHMEFDFLNGRYIAVNQDNDIVCIMKKWLSSYKGDSEYPGNAIPLYSGTELYIKKEYIEMLEKQFGTLMMKTCVESYTQTY